jgi:hypothetical protein
MGRREALAAFVGLLMLVALALTWAITASASDQSRPQAWFGYTPLSGEVVGCVRIGSERLPRSSIEDMTARLGLSSKQTTKLLRCFGYSN